MSAPQMSVVRPSFGSQPNETERQTSHGERVRSLQAETRTVARDHITELAAAIDAMSALADEISAGGEAYPVSVREVARRMAQEAPVAARTLRSALSRF